jgi:hypothetical protein
MRQASTTNSRASAGSSAARSACTQLKRMSDGAGIWNLSGSLATSAARSSLGNAKPITRSSRENAT